MKISYHREGRKSKRCRRPPLPAALQRALTVALDGSPPGWIRDLLAHSRDEITRLIAEATTAEATVAAALARAEIALEILAAYRANGAMPPSPGKKRS